MSGITLTSAVRQNLLSLQSTAELLSTTQNRLATGKKVNSALDNPTNFFTATGLEARASDINNLLDGIGNGVQALQAANTGITSLQKLVDTAKSIANQALQTTVGYTKSSVVGNAIAGATAQNLLGPTAAPTNATAVGGAVSNNNTGTAVPITTATRLAETASGTSDGLASALTTGESITVNGHAISFIASGATTGNQLALDTATVGDLMTMISTLSGGAVGSITAGAITLNTGTASDLVLQGTTGTLAKLGLQAVGTGPDALTRTVVRTPAAPPLMQGLTLNIAATGGGTPTAITFGTGPGQIRTLDGLNAALTANNMMASISTAGAITITTTNESASSNIGALTGTATSTGSAAFNGVSVVNAVADAASQATRASLVSQYNKTIEQITTTAQDASFNGVNLLNGDTLKLVFNETGRSTLSITGVNFGPAGLGLSSLVAGTDFIDNAAANRVLTSLNSASTVLRSQASTFGSNLSIVQIRQDFSKNLINVLQTGSSNLTLADTNEEAANSQALATRQSIAVSALALANQSQQGVLQLLR